MINSLSRVRERETGFKLYTCDTTRDAIIIGPSL